MCGRLELGSAQNNRKWLEDMVTHVYFMVDVKVEEGPDLAKRFHNYRAAQRKGEDVDWWSAVRVPKRGFCCVTALFVSICTFLFQNSWNMFSHSCCPFL